MISEIIMNGRGPSFFLHYEQMVQIVTHGLDQVVKNIERACAENKWSEKSSIKLLNEHDGHKNKGKLAMEMFEGSVVKHAGKTL